MFILAILLTRHGSLQADTINTTEIGYPASSWPLNYRITTSGLFAADKTSFAFFDIQSEKWSERKTYLGELAKFLALPYENSPEITDISKNADYISSRMQVGNVEYLSAFRISDGSILEIPGSASGRFADSDYKLQNGFFSFNGEELYFEPIADLTKNQSWKISNPKVTVNIPYSFIEENPKNHSQIAFMNRSIVGSSFGVYDLNREVVQWESKACAPNNISIFGKTHPVLIVFCQLGWGNFKTAPTYFYDLASGNQLYYLPGTSMARSYFKFHYDLEQIYYTSLNTKSNMYDVILLKFDGAKVAETPLIKNIEKFRYLTVSPDGRKAAILRQIERDQTQLEFYDLQNLKILASEVTLEGFDGYGPAPSYQNVFSPKNDSPWIFELIKKGDSVTAGLLWFINYDKLSYLSIQRPDGGVYWTYSGASEYFLFPKGVLWRTNTNEYYFSKIKQ